MSAGGFVGAIYESNILAETMPALVQPETLGLVLGGVANASAGDTVTLPLRVSMSRNRNSLGVKARTVALRWTAAPPTGYKADSTVRVPIMNPELFDAINPNISTGTYLGAAVICVGKTPEFVK